MSAVCKFKERKLKESSWKCSLMTIPEIENCHWIKTKYKKCVKFVVNNFLSQKELTRIEKEIEEIVKICHSDMKGGYLHKRDMLN